METLYRKYRPIDFDTVVGQDVIVKTLRNQIRSGKISHAYLFSGTRGTGKTTIAKIFARAINCPNEKEGNPCNECSACKSAIENANLNIYEMDAASNNGVEDIRHISELIEYPPINDEKYKVFIIDEVHALTNAAEQAFLKILEEPPEYVVYILATTDPNKLSETILSRCQKYNFKRINIDFIVDYLKKICEKENIEIDEEALSFIAEKSDGSMRESISKLDRCRAFSVNEKLTKNLVENILGIVGDEDFSELAKAINTGNIEKALKIVNDCVDRGKDLVQFINDFILHIRNILIVKDIKEPIETLNITKYNFDKLKKESEKFSKDVLIYFIEQLSKSANSMKFDENRRIILETAIIRLATPSTNFLESAVLARISSLEDKIKKGSYVKIETSEAVKTAENQHSSDLAKNKKEIVKELKLSKATFEEINKVIENWGNLLSSFDELSKNILSTAKPVPANTDEPGCINVLIEDTYRYNLLDEVANNKKLEEKLNEETKSLIQKEIIYKIIDIEKTNYSPNVSLVEKLIKEKIDFEIEDEK